MSPPTDDMDMDYDPEDEEGGSGSSQNGPTMMWFGFVVMGVFALWDYVAATSPAKGSYAILGVWLMFSTGIAITEVVYR